MEETMSNRVYLALAAAAAIFFGSLCQADAKSYMSIATGGTAGTYYAVGGGIAKVISKASDIQVTAETGNGSVANVNLLSKKEIEGGFVQSDIAYWAYNGMMMFKDKPVKNLRVVAALYPEHVQVLLAKEAGIKTIADFKGKRIGVGAPGSGVEADVQAIFQVAGLTYNDVKANFLDFAATTSRFKDKQLDAGFVVAGYPTASIMDLNATRDFTMLSFDDAFMKKLVAKHPYFKPDVIPANTYSQITTDVKTPSVVALLVTHADVPDALIYQFTKALFENVDDIHAVHSQAKRINLQTALDGATIPVHPGAAKYYTEKGLKVK